MCHLDIQKHVFYEKWFKYYVFFAYRLIQKFTNALGPMEGGGEFLMLILANLYCFN